jgi:DUF177 domain-containing protein
LASKTFQMVVTIEQIGADGLVLDQPIRAALVTAALESDGRSTGFKAAGEFQLHAELQKVSGSVLLRGRFEAPLVAPCKRCLTEVQVALPVEFILNLVPESKVRDKSERDGGEDDEGGPNVGSFALETADQELFDGRTIDLDPILKEQVLLALPMNVLCREDCKGLCPTCGKDLNEAQCACEPRPKDPRLAALKNIKLN